MQLTVSALSNPLVPFPTAKDAFDSPSIWLTSPVVAYSSWIGRQRYRHSSKTVYIAMFGKMVRWMESKGVPFHRCDKDHIAAFLDGEGISKGHRYRYVRMTERVFDHLAAIGAVEGNGTNPGRRAAIVKIGQGVNDATRFFSMEQVSAIVRFVEEGKEGLDEKKWIGFRDRALVGAILGGGAKVNQVKRMTVNCMTRPDGWIRKSDAARPAHRARLLPWAKTAIEQWIDLRAKLGVPGIALFPATVTGCGRLAGQAMHPASIFRRIKAVLDAAAIGAIDADASAARYCAQTLRNTYAAILMEDGASDELLTEYLGLQTIVSAQRLRTAWNIANQP